MKQEKTQESDFLEGRWRILKKKGMANMSNAATKMKMKGNHWVWHHDSHSDLDKNSLWRTVSENLIGEKVSLTSLNNSFKNFRCLEE